MGFTGGQGLLKRGRIEGRRVSAEEGVKAQLKVAGKEFERP